MQQQVTTAVGWNADDPFLTNSYILEPLFGRCRHDGTRISPILAGADLGLRRQVHPEDGRGAGHQQSKRPGRTAGQLRQRPSAAKQQRAEVTRMCSGYKMTDLPKSEKSFAPRYEFMWSLPRYIIFRTLDHGKPMCGTACRTHESGQPRGPCQPAASQRPGSLSTPTPTIVVSAARLSECTLRSPGRSSGSPARR